MHQLEFDFMLPRLEAEVTKFTAIQADKRNTYRKKVREIKKAGKEPMMSSNGYTGYSTAPVGGVEGDSPPAAKRAKLSGGEEGGDTEEEGVDEGEGDVEDEEVEDDEIEEEEEEVQEGLIEDPLEEREEEKDEDEEMGEESD
jgi:DNA polymerase epsilon subunit 3